MHLTHRMSKTTTIPIEQLTRVTSVVFMITLAVAAQLVPVLGATPVDREIDADPRGELSVRNEAGIGRDRRLESERRARVRRARGQR